MLDRGDGFINNLRHRLACKCFGFHKSARIADVTVAAAAEFPGARSFLLYHHNGAAVRARVGSEFLQALARPQWQIELQYLFIAHTWIVSIVDKHPAFVAT